MMLVIRSNCVIKLQMTCNLSPCSTLFLRLVIYSTVAWKSCALVNITWIIIILYSSFASNISIQTRERKLSCENEPQTQYPHGFATPFILALRQKKKCHPHRHSMIHKAGFINATLKMDVTSHVKPVQ